MTWAKLDDNFHAHPKIRLALCDCPASVGLHAMGLSWSAAYEQDGKVPAWFIESVIPSERDRQSAIDALVNVGLWKVNGEGFVIHDFLEYNPSHAELVERREKDRLRKERERGAG